MQTPQASQLVTDPKRSKMIKIRAERTIRPASLEREVQVGEVVEVPEAEAADFCKPIDGYVSHSGEALDQTVQTQKIVRAVRL